MNNSKVKDNLIAVSREAFLKSGFKGVSMRDISRLTGMALGNIYYYFPSKDALYKEVLRPLTQRLEKVMAEHNSDVNLTLVVFEKTPDEYPFIWHFTEIVAEFRSELNLLFFRSQGSSLENYPNCLVERAEIMGKEYLKRMKEKFPHINSDISPFLMRIISSIQITIMRELVSREDVPDEEFRQFVREYSLFNASGWRALLRV